MKRIYAAVASLSFAIGVFSGVALRPHPTPTDHLRMSNITFAMHIAPMSPVDNLSDTTAHVIKVAPPPPPVQAAAPTPTQTTVAPPLASDSAVLNWATSNANGCWYVWGGTGPCSAGYDCSGLVQAAVLHGAGVMLPRTTYEMLSSPLLQQVSQSSAQPGDLAFYGSGHVELFVRWAPGGGVTFGASEPGQRSTFHTFQWSWGWAPTGYYQVR